MSSCVFVLLTDKNSFSFFCLSNGGCFFFLIFVTGSFKGSSLLLKAILGPSAAVSRTFTAVILFFHSCNHYLTSN